MVDNINYTSLDYDSIMNIKHKWSGVKRYPRLISEHAISALDTQNYLTITSSSEDFSKIEFYLNGNMYYASAKNVTEAENIINEIF